MKKFVAWTGVSEDNIMKVVSVFKEVDDTTKDSISPDHRMLVIDNYNGVILNFTFQDGMVEDCYFLKDDTLLGMLKHIRIPFSDEEFSSKLLDSLKEPVERLNAPKEDDEDLKVFEGDK